jgi:hypothetical protein
LALILKSKLYSDNRQATEATLLMMNATSVAWIVCGAVLMGTFCWPYVKEFEEAAWIVHYETCSTRYNRYQALLKMKVCDKGENELAHQDTVNCAKARAEVLWGVWPCTIALRFQSHTVTSFLRHVWDSWYTWVLVLYVVYFTIRHWLYNRAEVQKHVISADALRDTITAVMHEQQRQRLPPSQQRQYLQQHHHYEPRVYLADESQ